MNKFAVERFATVSNGKIVAINEAFPFQELKDNQFEITKEEFKLIGNVESLERAEELIVGLKKKILKTIKVIHHQEDK